VIVEYVKGYFLEHFTQEGKDVEEAKIPCISPYSCALREGFGEWLALGCYVEGVILVG
jgi:hypothetical protein